MAFRPKKPQKNQRNTFLPNIHKAVLKLKSLLIDLICMKKNQCRIDILHPQIHILLPTEQMQTASDNRCFFLELAG